MSDIKKENRVQFVQTIIYLCLYTIQRKREREKTYFFWFVTNNKRERLRVTSKKECSPNIERDPVWIEY